MLAAICFIKMGVDILKNIHDFSINIHALVYKCSRLLIYLFGGIIQFMLLAVSAYRFPGFQERFQAF